MLKIRLMRIGTKKKPFYRVVVVDERNKRTGGYLELLGTYNPLTDPKDIKLNKEKIDHWLKQGAQLSDGYLRMTGKAPKRPPRKPKKEKKIEESPVVSPPAGEAGDQPAEKAEETKQEEKKEEAVVEEPKVEAEKREEKEEEIKQEEPKIEEEKLKEDERPT